MKILGIDTTRKKAQIFLIDTELKSKQIISINENIKHSEGLFLYIEKALLENKLTINDFDKFCVVVGPGSFTGIRVGMSTVKAFAKVCNKGIIPLNTFEVLSEQIKNGYVLLSSTMTSCYYSQIKNHKIVEDGVIDKSNIIELVDDSEVFVLEEEQNVIQLEYNKISVIDTLIDLYYNAVLKKLDTLEEVVPYYLQLSQAERNIKSE